MPSTTQIELAAGAWQATDARYRIEIHGVPSMALDLELGAFGRSAAHSSTLDAGFAVGAHVANAIPVVCEAACGVRSFLDLLPITRPEVVRTLVLLRAPQTAPSPLAAAFSQALRKAQGPAVAKR